MITKIWSICGWEWASITYVAATPVDESASLRLNFCDDSRTPPQVSPQLRIW
jgi:hypothetical protein